MESFLLAFFPLFVAIDVLGVVPLFVGMTGHLTNAQRRKLTAEATLTAFVISVVFLGAGKWLFNFLGISETDFRVGGGIVLLVLAVKDMLFPMRDRGSEPGASIGVVPIGIPLIMGPAALTTILILVDTYGYVLTVASLLLNMLLVWMTFLNARKVSDVLGTAGSQAVAKVAALILAGIAVHMIRSGIVEMTREI